MWLIRANCLADIECTTIKSSVGFRMESFAGEELFEAKTIVRPVWSVDQIAHVRCLDTIVEPF